MVLRWFLKVPSTVCTIIVLLGKDRKFNYYLTLELYFQEVQTFQGDTLTMLSIYFSVPLRLFEVNVL